MPWRVLAVISAGGVIGALARYGIIVTFPEPDAAFASMEEFRQCVNSLLSRWLANLKCR